MNVTKYKGLPDEKKVYFGKASIKKGYYVVAGDENFYALVGDNSCYPITDLIHPDEIPEFLGAVEKLNEQPQSIIVRVKCYNNKYRLLYMVLKYNGRILDGFKSFDIEFDDIMSINEHYIKYLYNIKKYRKFMSLSSDMYFEYKMDSEDFEVYKYLNTRSCPVFEGNLKQLESEIRKSTIIDFEHKVAFEALCDSLRNGLERFETCVDGAVFGESESGITYKIKGSTVYKDNARDMVVGTIACDGKEHEKEAYYLTDMANDPATGVFNKRAINEYAIEKIQEEGNDVYFAIMDIDDFKSINDTYGHMFGDEVLAKVSEIIKSVVSARGVVGRFGGDEFLIVLDGIKSEQDLRLILKTISKHIQWSYNGIKGNLMLTTSFGVSKYPEDGTTYEELFKKADKSLYIAKEKGKNRYVIYDERKHGPIKQNGDMDGSIGIKSMISSEEKTTVMSELVLDLHKYGKTSIISAMEKMKAYFDMDGVTIYAGKDMKRMYSIGKYVGEIAYLECMKQPRYLDMFDSNGVYVESKVKRLEGKIDCAYKLYEKQENGKFIQCACFEEGVPVVVVSFDFFNRSPKYGTEDTAFITIIGKLLAQVVAESIKSQD